MYLRRSYNINFLLLTCACTIAQSKLPNKRNIWHHQRFNRQPYSKAGFPSLYNCETEQNEAQARPMPLDFELMIIPNWSDFNEFLEEPDIVYKYEWSYRLVFVQEKNGKKFEESLNIERFLFRNNTSLMFHSYSLNPGLYIIYPKATLKNPADKLASFTIEQCYLYVVDLVPIAVIEGGNYRVVPEETSLTMNGSNSIDLNTPIKDSSSLKFQWSCFQKLTPPSFCTKNPVSFAKSFVLLAEYLVPDEKFEVVLKITSYYNSTAETRQEIEVISNAALLEISCQKNCPPVSEWSNTNITTYFLVECKENCIKNRYYWSIISKTDENFAFDYVGNTQFGRNIEKFIIKEGSLQPGEYLVSVKLLRKEGQASMTLFFENPPSVENCITNPRSGRSLETNFLLKCNRQMGFRRHFYEVYFTEGEDANTTFGELIIGGFYPEIEEIFFKLPSSKGRKFRVKVSLENGPATIVDLLHPEVVSSLSSQSPERISETFGKIYDGSKSEKSLVQKMIEGNPREKEEGIGTLQALINEVIDVESGKKEVLKKFVDDLKYHVTSDLLRVPFTTVRQIMQVGDTVTKLLTYDEPKKPDPLSGKFSSTFCKKLTHKYTEILKMERFPLSCGDICKRIANTLSKCLETNSNPNFDALKPLLLDIIIQPGPTIEPAPLENYPDYVDFPDKYFEDISHLQQVSHNVITGSETVAKSVALTTAVGEEPIIRKGKITEILVAKDKAYILAQSKLELSGVLLQPSLDWRYSDHPMDILISSWNKDILWWNLNGNKVATHIININFWHSTCKKRVTKFKNPNDIYLNLTHEGFERDIVEGRAAIPENYSRLIHYELNPYIYVRRTSVPPQNTLVVQFHNVSRSTVFKAVVTCLKFPTIEDFTPGTTFNAFSNKSLLFTNSERHTVWCYLGVLPDKHTKEAYIVFYISFTCSCCIRWKPNLNNWEIACDQGSKTSAETIHCRCIQSSTLAGYIQNSESIIQRVLPQEAITMDLHPNFLIFLTVASIIFLYCTLLLFKLGNRKKKTMLYFLADNLARHRYAYLVIVTTGNKGTTSHVTITINGSLNSSHAHVLNFPDPKMRLLQKKSKDAFVVTNETYLGNIENIKLWIDCIGPRPLWFCEEIKIYDLQTKKLWYFNVEQLFSVENGNIIVTLQPTKFKKKQKPVSKFLQFLKNLSLWNELHTWRLCGFEKNFSFVKRLTVVLSKMLMCCSLVLIFLKMPELKPRDVFDMNNYRISWRIVRLAATACSISFIFHIIAAWIFRVSAVQFSDRKQNDTFSNDVTKFCWKILIWQIIISTIILLIYGFWVPYTKSLVWLTSIGICLALDIIILENLFIFIIRFFYKPKEVECVEEEFSTVMSVIEQQRLFLSQHLGRSLLRPYVKHLHSPVNTKHINARKMTAYIRRNFSEEISDIIMVTVYTIILYIVVLVGKDRFTVINRNEIESMFQGMHTRTLSFFSIENITQVYQYINDTLIPIIQPLYWYGNYSISHPGMMIDSCNNYLGVVRFRQQRITKGTCDIPQLMKTFFNTSHCQPEFNTVYEERGNFGYGWGNISTNFKLERLKSIWRYFADEKTGTLSFFGDVAVYPGGGYVAYLGRNLHNSYMNLHRLVSKRWIDKYMRGFFIEFLIYNANYNMFSSVTLLFEQSATGYVSKKIEIYSTRMIFVHTEVERIAVIFFGLFAAWVALLLIKRSIALVKNIWSFYKSWWFLADLMIIIVSIACIALFMIRVYLVGDYLGSLEKGKNNDFISYFMFFYIEDFLSIFAAFLVLISTARLWKFLHLGVFFRILERTLSLASFPLFSTTLAFFVLLLAFGMSGVLIFGNEFPELSSLMKITATLVALSLKPDQFDMTNYTKTTLSYLYFSAYLWLMQIILFIYIIVIIMAYVRARLDLSGESFAYNIKTYFLEEVQYIPKFLRQRFDRMSGGGKKHNVNPKSDEFRYANCLSIELSRLLSMNFLTKCVLKNLNQEESQNLTNDDLLSVLKVYQKYVLPSKERGQIEIFFKGHFVGERIRLIDERKIMKIAHVVECVLDQQKKTKVGSQNNEIASGWINMIEQSQKTMLKCDLVLRSLHSCIRTTETFIENYDDVCTVNVE